MTYFAFFRTFGPYVVIVGLIMAVLFMRGDLIKAGAESKAAKAEAASLREVNKTNAATIASQAKAREASDKIVVDVAKQVAEIRARGNEARVTIREVYRNDPQAKSWADTPVPGGVRNALETRR